MFVRSLNAQKETVGIAAVYRGEIIAAGKAAEVKEALKDIWFASGIALKKELEALYEIASFVSKISPQLKTEINEACFWSGKPDIMGGFDIALSIAQSRKK